MNKPKNLRIENSKEMNDEKEKNIKTNIKTISKKPKSAIFNKLKEFNLKAICTPINKKIEIDKNKIDENKEDNSEKESQNINMKQEYFLNNNIFNLKNNSRNKYHLNYNNKESDDHDNNIKLNPDEKLKIINETEKQVEEEEDITNHEKEKNIKKIIKKGIKSKYIKTKKHQHHEKKEINEQIDISDFIPQIKDKFLIEKEIEKIKNEEKTKYINTEYNTGNLLEKVEKEYYRKNEVNDIKKKEINQILNEKLKKKVKEEKSKENNKEKDYFKSLNLNALNLNFNSNHFNNIINNNNKGEKEINEYKNCKKSTKNYNKKIGKFNLFLNKAFSNKFLFKDETNLYNSNSNSNTNINNINLDKIKKLLKDNISRNNQKSKYNYFSIKSFSNRHLATTIQSLSENKKKNILTKNNSHNNKTIRNLEPNLSIKDMINFMSSKKRINSEQNDKKEDLLNLPYSQYSTLWSNKFLNINYNSGIHYTDIKHGVPQLKIKKLKKKNLPPLYLTNNKFKSDKNKIFKTYSSNHKTYNLNMEINRINDYKNKNYEKETGFKSYKISNEIEFTNINEINSFNQKYMSLIYED